MAGMSEEFETLSDKALVSCTLEGSERAFELLYERHYWMVYRVAYRLSGTKEDAQDIAQEVFVRTARHLKTYQGKAKFTTWLYRTTMNAAIDWRRKVARRREGAEKYYREAEPIDAVDSDSSQVLEALDTLSHQEREAIVLVFYEDMTHREAAEVLGRKEGTVSWRIYQAKRKLKKYLQQDGDHE